MASQRTASPYICAMASAPGIEVGGHLQLVERALPLAEHAQQLEQEDAQLGVGRLGAHLLLQMAPAPRPDRRSSDSASAASATLIVGSQAGVGAPA